MSEGLNHFLIDAARKGELIGLVLALGLNLIHLLFVDDILLFYRGSKRDIDCLHIGITLFKIETRMQINLYKFTLSFFHLREVDMRYLTSLFPIQATDLSDEIKYLGFHLKPNGYKKID